MDNDVLFNVRRKNNVKTLLRPKNIKMLTSGYSTKVLKPDFDKVELELENINLRKMIGLLEGKNHVLEEHCGFLREKNLYFETRLRDVNREIKEIRESGATDKDNLSETESEEVQAQENTSLKDKLSGAIFGVALPNVGKILGKIKEKAKEIKEAEGGDHECPLSRGDFKEKIEALKVNLFRVVVVVGTLMILSGVGYAGYRIWKTRYRHPAYLTPSDEEEDELFSTPEGPGGSESLLKNNSTDSFESPGISTDFRSILATASKK